MQDNRTRLDCIFSDRALTITLPKAELDRDGCRVEPRFLALEIRGARATVECELWQAMLPALRYATDLATRPFGAMFEVGFLTIAGTRDGISVTINDQSVHLETWDLVELEAMATLFES